MIGDNLLLRVDNLSVHYHSEQLKIKAVNNISFNIGIGNRFGLVGESGSGKTTVVKAILKILPPGAEIISGKISFKNENLLSFTEKQMDRIRWKNISLVTQSAMNALNPVARISDQMYEIFDVHEQKSKQEMYERCIEIFDMVGINPNRFNDYPHQFSGGMRQRVIIAMALALDPMLIIADEPTTALDVIMQAQIIDLLRTLADKKNIAVLIITHNIAVVAELCQSVGVMYAGRLMEYGDIQNVFMDPHHPYTMGLQGAFPSIKDLNKSLISIPGSSPSMVTDIDCCGFSDRCPFAIEKCRKVQPESVELEKNHYVSCHRYQSAHIFRKEIGKIFGFRTKS